MVPGITALAFGYGLVTGHFMIQTSDWIRTVVQEILRTFEYLVLWEDIRGVHVQNSTYPSQSDTEIENSQPHLSLHSFLYREPHVRPMFFYCPAQEFRLFGEESSWSEPGNLTCTFKADALLIPVHMLGQSHSPHWREVASTSAHAHRQ